MGEGDGGNGGRRGLHTPSIQRGKIARLAIRSIRAARAVAWQAAEVVLALVILFEEWGWRPLSAAIARLARVEVVARLERAIVALPPWPALGVFLVPSLLFLPLKLAALWLIGGGHLLWATLLFAFAKIAGTALYARIFQLTQPTLMQLAWFARAYNWFMPWKEAIVAHAKSTAAWKAAMALKARARLLAGEAWRAVRPVAMAAVARLRALLGGG
ncbi:MAG: hypothetical protein AB7O57_05620 [Hyphomicrobiaceae bacterium]